MCGLTGWLGAGIDDLAGALTHAVTAIAHRGPDDQGIWIDREADIGLAHCRLAIQDLSPAGHQPMASPDRRWILVFNGEIYNHFELRSRLEREAPMPIAWRGHSDTETLLAAFGAWGIEATLTATIGMFAFALWDRQQRRLTLGRDRLGEKPLYYGRVGRGVAFASELKALRTLPGFDDTIDRHALAGMMAFNATPGTMSIFEGIAKLAPGCLVTLTLADVRRGLLPAQQAWWRLDDAVLAGLRDPLPDDDEQGAIDELERVLSEAVRSQMISDVPLGAFLSGGIDSSTVVALMQRQSSRPVRTFAIGFHEDAYDEAPHSRAVARHLGTDHHELYVDDRTARDVIPLLPQIYCEPFSDPSQIPTCLVSKMARDQVAVSLSGDAGDELFGGYDRYFTAAQAWSIRERLPKAARTPLGRMLRTLGHPGLQHWLDRPLSWLPARARSALGPSRLKRAADLLLSPEAFEPFYRDGFTRFWPPDLVRGVDSAASPIPPIPPAGLGHFDRMMYLDLLGYLPDDILVKVDRAAMAVSLETRVPMLDRRVVELAWRLPPRYKARDASGKWLLREVLARHVPRSLTERPKMGFGVPIDAWLRGPLRDWAETLLARPRLQQAGWFDVDAVRQCWASHLSGAADREGYLWPVLMFEAWRESLRDSRNASPMNQASISRPTMATAATTVIMPADSHPLTSSTTPIVVNPIT